MTCDCNSRYCAIDPRHGAALSVAEAYRNISSVGAKPLAISDCLNFGNPENPEGMWEIAEGIRGLGEACRIFEVPVVSGNVSLYNETRGKGILPTPMVAMVGHIEDANKAVTAHFQNEGDRIFLIGETREDELGGSEYAASIFSALRGKLPLLDYDLEKKTAACVRDLIDKGLLHSCHDLSAGGLFVALAESCIGDYATLGAKLTLEQKPERADKFLFAETGARYLVTCSADREEEVKAVIHSAGLKVTAHGTVGGDILEVEGLVRLDLGEAKNIRESGLDELIAS